MSKQCLYSTSLQWSPSVSARARITLGGTRLTCASRWPSVKTTSKNYTTVNDDDDNDGVSAATLLVPIKDNMLAADSLLYDQCDSRTRQVHSASSVSRQSLDDALVVRPRLGQGSLIPTLSFGE